MRWLALSVAGTTVSAVGLIAVIRRGFVMVRVTGSSMSPTLRDGQWLLARRCHDRAVRAGQIIVFRVASDRSAISPALRVKRIVAGPGDPVPEGLQPAETSARLSHVVPSRCLAVAGDAPRAQGTRELGFVSFDDVIAVVRDPSSRRSAVAVVGDARGGRSAARSGHLQREEAADDIADGRGRHQRRLAGGTSSR